MIIDIIDDERYLTTEQVTLIQEVVELTAKYLKMTGEIEVDISIVSNEEIHQLNLEYRQIDRPTDVLSFALEEVSSEFDITNFSSFTLDSEFTEDEKEVLLDDDQSQEQAMPRHLGDIIISYPKAHEQAVEYQHSFERELAFLAVHGFLHLNGFDHQTKEEEAAMFGIQEEVLSQHGLTR